MSASKHGFLMAALFSLMLALPATARAEYPKWLDLDVAVGLGGPVGLIGASYPGGVTTAPFTVMVAGRLGFPDHSPLELEINAVIPHGLGLNLRLEVFKALDRITVHAIDPGIFFNLGQPVSAARIKRSFDLTLGVGCDVRVWEGLNVGLDWRVFLPDPFSVIAAYDGFAYPAYSEAVRGGQLWLTASYTW